MSLFSKYYLEIITILIVGLINSPETILIKLSLFFMIVIWALLHIFIFNKILNSDIVENLIKEVEINVADKKLKYKYLKKIYYVLIMAALLVASFFKGGLILYIGLLIIIVEIFKIILIKNKKTSS
jgi:hypothetical protein